MQQPLSRQFVELGLQIHTHDDLWTVYVTIYLTQNYVLTTFQFRMTVLAFDMVINTYFLTISKKEMKKQAPNASM
jgi:hypothetical protein